MMKFPWTAVLLLVMVLTTHAGSDGYHLVWSDEFNRDGPPDSANWTYEEGFVRNQELQWYQSDNAFCRDGVLVIEGRRERKPNPGYREESGNWRRQRKEIEYTSSCLTTRGRHDWQFGRFEIRARIVAQDGLWPAIWFLGRDGRWPSNGEIDLMEYYQGTILANACWGTEERGQARWDHSRTPLRSLGGPEWDRAFHLWRMEWDEQQIALFVDDRLLNTIDLTKTINPTTRGPRNPFHQPHYLLLNLAIGGTQGGEPSSTPFPTRYEIDHVRVYQKTPSPDPPDEPPEGQ